eukprot:gene33624-59977_t
MRAHALAALATCSALWGAAMHGNFNYANGSACSMSLACMQRELSPFANGNVKREPGRFGGGDAVGGGAPVLPPVTAPAPRRRAGPTAADSPLSGSLV